MLAQYFMPAEALGITDEQREALIKVLGMFERGEISAERFDMNVWDCGTVMCIGGWAEHVGGVMFIGSDGDPILSSSHIHPTLEKLFFPHDMAFYCRDPRRGALALRSFLTTGGADWPGAMTADL